MRDGKTMCTTRSPACFETPIRAQARSYRGRPSATGKFRQCRANHQSPDVGAPLAGEPSRAYRIIHTQNTPADGPQDATCPPHSRCRSPLADEPDLPIRLIQGIAAKAAPTGLFAFGDRDGRSDVLALRPGEGCNAGRKDDVHGAESGVFRNAHSRASALLLREAISHRQIPAMPYESLITNHESPITSCKPYPLPRSLLKPPAGSHRQPPAICCPRSRS